MEWIVLERETRKCNGWKELAGISEFGETDCWRVTGSKAWGFAKKGSGRGQKQGNFKTRTLKNEGMRHPLSARPADTRLCRQPPNKLLSFCELQK
jgi:hypothetical protein